MHCEAHQRRNRMVEISKYGSGEGRPRAIGGAYSTGHDEFWNRQTLGVSRQSREFTCSNYGILTLSSPVLAFVNQLVDGAGLITRLLPFVVVLGEHAELGGDVKDVVSVKHQREVFPVGNFVVVRIRPQGE